MKKPITAAIGATALALPVANAIAATPKKVLTVTKKVAGAQGQAGQWGVVQVTLVVRKTTTIVGTRKTVTRKITAVSVPVFPNHAPRSVYINKQAVPFLVQEALQAQFTGTIDMISGATFTSQAFFDSLTAALAAAEQV